MRLAAWTVTSTKAPPARTTPACAIDLPANAASAFDGDPLGKEPTVNVAGVSHGDFVLRENLADELATDIEGPGSVESTGQATPGADVSAVGISRWIARPLVCPHLALVGQQHEDAVEVIL